MGKYRGTSDKERRMGRMVMGKKIGEGDKKK